MKIKRIFLWVVYVIVAAAIVFAVVSTKGFGLLNKNNNNNSSGWQAVFLTNGQVYFGHLSDMNQQFVKLTNIFYLQVNQQQSLQSSGSSSPSTGSSSSPNLTLIKLGNELHGPTDQMNINRDQILFTEDLKSSSQVVSSINKYYANNK